MALDPTRNFVNVQVVGGYDHLATEIVLAEGEITKLPDPATEGHFNLTYYNWSDFKDPSDDPFVERVRVTARTADTLTILRAQEGTAATAKNIAGKTYRMTLSWGRINAEQMRNHPLTTKGDIPVFGTAKTRLPVGADGQALLADSVQPLGVRWGAPPAGITSGWELIRTGTFTADTNITGLDGDTDKLWMLVMSARSNGGFKLRFNGDTGTNYGGSLHYHSRVTAGTTMHTVGHYAPSSFIELSITGGYREFSKVIISSVSGKRRSVIFQTFSNVSAIDYANHEGGFVWTNTANNITTINILTSTTEDGEFFLFRRRA